MAGQGACGTQHGAGSWSAAPSVILHRSFALSSQSDRVRDNASSVHGHRQEVEGSGARLVREAGVQHRVARDLAQVRGAQLPHLRRHAVLLHERLLGQVDLHPNASHQRSTHRELANKAEICNIVISY